MASGIESLVEELDRSYRELQERQADPSVYNDHREAAQVGRKLRELEEPHQLAEQWREIHDDLEAARQDGELRELVPDLESRLLEIEEELRLALVQGDP